MSELTPKQEHELRFQEAERNFQSLTPDDEFTLKLIPGTELETAKKVEYFLFLLSDVQFAFEEARTEEGRLKAQSYQEYVFDLIRQANLNHPELNQIVN
jgi:hypothetical protein